MKILIPAQTVEVDAEAWALDYGIDLNEVRADVKGYFHGLPQEMINNLRLNEGEYEK
tara:strand:+ start:224 stop:394 length:171 start_codon:yes stop_codon:yes gene_type:complete